MRVSARLIACIALVALMVSPAAAHRQAKTDPNDTQGDLDIREVSFRDANGRFRLTLTTFGNWTVADMESGDSPPDNQFIFALDSKGNSDNDYSVIVDALGGEMVAAIYSEASNEIVAKFPTFKNGKTTGASFRKGRVDPRPSYVKWGAASRATGDRVNCNNVCLDRVPSNGLYRHPL